MFRPLAVASLLTLSCVMPQLAAAQDLSTGPTLGGIFGGLPGGRVTIVDGTEGAAISAHGRPSANGFQAYNNACYIQRPSGAWLLVAPQNCTAPSPAASPFPVIIIKEDRSI